MLIKIVGEMIMNIQTRSYSMLTVVDLCCMTLGFFSGIFLRHGDFAIMNVYSVYREVYVVLAISIIMNAFLFRPYEDIFRRGYWVEFVNVAKCIVVQMAVAVAYMFVMQISRNYSRLAFAFAIMSISILTYAGRMFAKYYLKSIVEKSVSRKKLLVVTTSNNAGKLLDSSHSEVEFNYEISSLAIMDKNMIGQTISGVPVTASAETLYDDARLTVVDSVLIALEPEHPQFKETINLFHVMGVEVNVSLQDYNLGIPNQRIVKMGDLTVLSGNTQKMALGDTIAKRMLDILGGIVGLIFTGIFVIIIGPAIIIESPGPIFFSQTRIGKNGRRFKIYKFRSMYMDAEERKKELMEKNKMSGLMFKMDDDPRITKVGKFIRKTSIDEFPQFLNVLKGDMSLVGTRPPTEDEFKQYKARYKKRLAMKPGITGLWQVSGRSSITDFEDVVKLDVQYIENWSFGLDLKILIQTVLVVLRHDGAQ